MRCAETSHHFIQASIELNHVATKRITRTLRTTQKHLELE